MAASASASPNSPLGQPLEPPRPHVATSDGDSVESEAPSPPKPENLDPLGSLRHAIRNLGKIDSRIRELSDEDQQKLGISCVAVHSDQNKYFQLCDEVEMKAMLRKSTPHRTL